MSPIHIGYRRGRRWLVGLGLVGCVVFHLLVIVRLLLSPEQVCARIEQSLERQFPGQVAIGTAGYIFPDRVRLGGIELRRPADRGGGVFLSIKGLVVNLDLVALLRGEVQVAELLLEEPEMFVLRSDLVRAERPQPALRKAPIERVVIRGGRIHIAEGVFFEGSPGGELRNVSLELTEERRLANGFGFVGDADSDLWGRCDLEGTLDLASRRLDAVARARGIAIDQRLRQMLPEAYVKVLDLYNIEGTVDLTAETSIQWGGQRNLSLRATADLRDCKARWVRFPLQCTGIRGKIVLDGGNIYYQNITARAGPATITLWGQTTPEKVVCHIVARDRPLDRELYEACNPVLRRVWDNLGVTAGMINVDHRSTWWRKERRFEAAIRTQVRGAAATYKKFPYPLSDISGSVFWENGVTVVECLRGRHGNARVQITGQVSDKGVPDLYIEAVNVPFDQTLRNALTPGWRKTFDDLQPQGTTSVKVWVTSPTNDPNKLAYRFVISPEGASFQHKAFPHRFTDVRGEIVVDETGTISLRELTATLGKFPVRLLGTIRPGPKGQVLDLTVLAPEVELGPAARAFLSPAAQKVYDDLHPQGRVAVAFHVTTDPAGGNPRHSTEVTCLQGCSVQHRSFPLRLTGLMGNFRVDGTGRTIFTGMKGRLGKAAVEVVDGSYVPGPEGGMSFTLRASGLALDERLAAALPETWQKVWKEVAPSGLANVEYQFASNPKDPKHPSQKVTIEPAEAAFCYRGLPLKINDVTRGKVVVDQDGNTTISNIQGKLRGKTVTINGKATVGAGGARKLLIEVEAEELALDQELHDALPPEWRALWDELKLAGAIRAHVSATVDVGTRRWDHFRLDATLKQCEATYAKFPARLTDLSGRAEYNNGVLELSNVVGRAAVADEVRLRGRIAKGGGGTIEVTARGVRLDEDIRKVVPPELRQLLETIDLKGKADTQLTVVRVAKPDGPLHCSGTIRLRDATFHCRYDFEKVTGEIRIDEGAIAPDGSEDFKGSVDLRRLAVGKHEATELKGGFIYVGRPAKKGNAYTSKLIFTDLTGSFYGGRLSARFAVEPGAPRQFTGRLALRNADFQLLSTEGFGLQKPVRGTLDLALEFPPGTFKDQGAVGDGAASVTRGELGELPLAAALFNALGLRSPLDRSITEAEMKFSIKPDVIVVHELSLLGESRLLTGQGTVGFDRSLNLRLVSPKSGVPLIELVPLVPKLIREQLLQIEVKGTLEKPTFRVLPVPVIPRLAEQFARALGLWREKRPVTPEKKNPPK